MKPHFQWFCYGIFQSLIYMKNFMDLYHYLTKYLLIQRNFYCSSPQKFQEIGYLKIKDSKRHTHRRCVFKRQRIRNIKRKESRQTLRGIRGHPVENPQYTCSDTDQRYLYKEFWLWEVSREKFSVRIFMPLWSCYKTGFSKYASLKSLVKQTVSSIFPTLSSIS